MWQESVVTLMWRRLSGHAQRADDTNPPRVAIIPTFRGSAALNRCRFVLDRREEDSVDILEQHEFPRRVTFLLVSEPERQPPMTRMSSKPMRLPQAEVEITVEHEAEPVNPEQRVAVREGVFAVWLDAPPM